jgi:hypothetical protein
MPTTYSYTVTTYYARCHFCGAQFEVRPNYTPHCLVCNQTICSNCNRSNFCDQHWNLLPNELKKPFEQIFQDAIAIKKKATIIFAIILPIFAIGAIGSPFSEEPAIFGPVMTFSALLLILGSINFVKKRNAEGRAGKKQIEYALAHGFDFPKFKLGAMSQIPKPQEISPQQTLTCAKCGAQNPLSNQFCGHCGAEMGKQ